MILLLLSAINMVYLLTPYGGWWNAVAAGICLLVFVDGLIR